MLDLKQVNDSQFIPISEEERLINELKPSAFNSVKIWIENITGKHFTYPNDFRKSLADGVLLCNLLNSLKPGTIKRINKISTALSGYEESTSVDNLGKFLRCCEDDFGLSPLILFEISDLEDLSEKSCYQLESEKRLERVLMCLFHLAKSVENHLTSFTVDSNPFQLLLKSQDIREMKKNKTPANTDDSVFESLVPELIQKQTPNYLAHKAEQTLKQTKMNQEILQKSLENDDWQESLENWREKRRQVLSQSIVETSNNDLQNDDSKELMKLKEKARKMKQLRDQIKDQSIQAINDEGDCKSSSSIPDIDEEMKAMIERVKMKKLAEEQKRQFTLSSPIKSSFASDSELSTSTAHEKFEEDSLSISEKNENDHSFCDNQLIPNITDNNILSNEEINKPDYIPSGSETRIVQIKLIQRSKQDSDQWWGMDLVDKSGIILVSKVKIGSTSDVCDVRKGDEIISINSTNVTNQSIENVKSIFTKYASTLSPTEFITLSLKRIVNDDEDEDFLYSDISEKNDDNPNHPVNGVELECNSKIHINHNDVNSIAKDFEQIDNLNIESTNSEMYPIITKEIPKYSYQNADKNSVISETVERRRNYDEKSSSNSINNISIIKPEIPRLITKNEIESDNDCQLSVQAKIAKFECQKISNPLNLNSSLNIPRIPQNPEFSSVNTKFRQQSSCDGISLNQDDTISKLTEENHSSISNLYYYWETEAPKSIDSSSKNLINKNAPYIQTPIYSLVNEKEKNDKFILEAAEQHLDTSNVNTVKTWRNGRSSCNSSTSDDVSALNDSINMPQYGAWGKSVEKTCENPVSANAKSNSSISLSREISPNPPVSISSGNKFVCTDINYNPKSNISTGIQTNIPSRQKPVYTTITTAFENLSKKPGTNSISKIADEESYSVSCTKLAGNICNLTGALIPSSEIGQPIVNPQMSWQPSNNNDLSKDFTLISSSITGKENQKNPSDTYSSRTIGSNISGSLDENEKSIDVEVTVPPKLFPMRNKTLLPKFSNDKILIQRIGEPNVKNRSFEEDETTLKSNDIKITDLDDVITPINQKSNTSVKIDTKASPTKKGDGVYLDISKMDNTPIQCAANCTDNDSFDKHQSNDCSDILESNIDIEQTISAISAPTLFKSNKNADNTISVGMTLSKSENYIPIKNESSSSDKKSRKSNSKSNELQNRKSSSTKDLRYSEMDKSNTNNPDRSSHISSNQRKHSPSQVTFSDVIQDITQTKTETKTFSIEKSIKTAPILSKSDKKKSKSQNKKSSPAELSTKCNNCLQAAGSEDLMVIEELNLHFHLRCFTCSECHVQLGDGKSDTDVRIRRSKLHCAICYNKKSSRSKHRSSAVNRHQQSLSNNISNKGGHGDGHNVYIAPGDSNNNCIFSSVITRVPSASITTFTNS